MNYASKALLLALLGLWGVAQDSSAPHVVIPLTVTGRHHQPISVTVTSLIIRDQKTPVNAATLLRGANFPMELGVLVDTSNSQRSAHIEGLLKAMNQFVVERISGPEDRVFFLTFDTQPHASEWLKKEQLQTFAMKIRYGGATALYDALAVACKERMGPREWRKPSRRVLILITDGEDNQSHATRGEAVSEALKAGTVVFTINTINAASSVGGKGEKTLEYFASLTGGESFSGPEPRALTRIRDLIDGMYFLSYVPTGGAQTGMHEIEVKPAPKNKFEISYAREYLWNP